ncbi:TetR/AcrR family transcriptional regulator [Streptomyces sp. CB09001]|uniref:TetR/AcrR family transcriptional regulator n=1 Tax=Streptomyces sp. CB09001 TaxID=2083284 RepID=UPI000E20F68F|nr:TetR/AcrR family transcriptional regulator [Streptomyces sp. CB09001]AXL92894.1 TetR/AcrR family transcriptional regulator [Streptomyces sp. CB09001]
MAAPGNTQAATRKLRADALRNRQRILEAARQVFEDRGLDAPLDEVAERAGVGAGTLYRRFPTRAALVEAAFEKEILQATRIAEEALHCEDPWVGFSTYFERLCSAMAADRGLSDLLTLRLPTSDLAAGCRDRQARAVAGLLRQAQEAGAVRDDLVPEDIFLFLVANSAVTSVTRCSAPHAWRRLVALLLDACRPENTGPLPAAPTPLQTMRAEQEHAQAKGLGYAPGSAPSRGA